MRGHTTSLSPLLVHIHGGPNSQSSLSWKPQAQFYASRGVSFLSINYRGSYGFGKYFQDELLNNWGKADVEDAYDGAQFIINQGLADAKKIFISGNSAGGLTCFLSLIKYPNFWKAAISCYGISDLISLNEDCHRFEKYYNDLLLGPLDTNKHIWLERSPINYIDKICSPILLFHGLNDKVVNPNQSKVLFDSLQKKGVPCKLHLLENEGHGFSKITSQEMVIEKSYAFIKEYCK